MQNKIKLSQKEDNIKYIHMGKDSLIEAIKTKDTLYYNLDCIKENNKE
jgi:hypothetical protein